MVIIIVEKYDKNIRATKVGLYHNRGNIRWRRIVYSNFDASRTFARFILIQGNKQTRYVRVSQSTCTNSNQVRVDRTDTASDIGHGRATATTAAAATHTSDRLDQIIRRNLAAALLSAIVRLLEALIVLTILTCRPLLFFLGAPGTDVMFRARRVLWSCGRFIFAWFRFCRLNRTTAFFILPTVAFSRFEDMCVFVYLHIYFSILPCDANNSLWSSTTNVL